MSDRSFKGTSKFSRGMTLLGFIFVLVIVLFFVYIGIKLVPIYLNHMSVSSELNSLAAESGAANTPPNTLRRNLMTRLQVSYVDHVAPDNITVVRGATTNLVVDYQVETHLIANIDAVLSFRAEAALSN